MSLDNLGNKQIIILNNCEINNEKYDLHTDSQQDILEQNDKQSNKKNFKQTKTDYTKNIFKTKKRILRIRNKSFRRTV